MNEETENALKKIIEEIALECKNYIESAKGPYAMVSVRDLKYWEKQLSEVKYLALKRKAIEKIV